MVTLKKELEKQKELLSSSVVKVKWAENKIKAEAEQHKVSSLLIISSVELDFCMLVNGSFNGLVIVSL